MFFNYFLQILILSRCYSNVRRITSVCSSSSSHKRRSRRVPDRWVTLIFVHIVLLQPDYLNINLSFSFCFLSVIRQHNESEKVIEMQLIEVVKQPSLVNNKFTAHKKRKLLHFKKTVMQSVRWICCKSALDGWRGEGAPKAATATHFNGVALIFFPVHF